MNYEIGERIITGAADLFFTYGFSKVTMDEIAEKAGVVKKTIYNHFPNKQALLQAVIECQIENTITALDEISHDQELNFMEKLNHIAEYVFAEFGSQKKPLLVDLYKYTTIETQNYINPRIRDRIIQRTQELLEEGMEKGIVKEDIPREIIPYFYITIVEGIKEVFRDTELPFTPGQLLMESIKITYEGILTPKGRDLLSREGP